MSNKYVAVRLREITINGLLSETMHVVWRAVFVLSWAITLYGFKSGLGESHFWQLVSELALSVAFAGPFIYGLARLLLRLALLFLYCMEFGFRSVASGVSTARDFIIYVARSGLLGVRNNSSGQGFERFVDLLGRLLPRKLRNESWEPHKEDLIADYLESRRYRTRWAKRWLKFCLAVNVCLAFVDCIRVGLQSQLGKFIVSLLPPRLREWILGSGK